MSVSMVMLGCDGDDALTLAQANSCTCTFTRVPDAMDVILYPHLAHSVRKVVVDDDLFDCAHEVAKEHARARERQGKKAEQTDRETQRVEQSQRKRKPRR